MILFHVILNEDPEARIQLFPCRTHRCSERWVRSALLCPPTFAPDIPRLWISVTNWRLPQRRIVLRGVLRALAGRKEFLILPLHFVSLGRQTMRGDCVVLSRGLQRSIQPQLG